MGAGRWLGWAMLVTCACEWKPSPAAPPAQVPETARSPDATQDELERFLHGMLVTTNIPQPSDPIWPAESVDSLFEWARPNLERGWGIKTAAQLYEAIDLPDEKLRRSEAWLLGNVRDKPHALKAWKNVLAENHEDLEAAINVADLANTVEGPAAAIDALAGVVPERTRNIDWRSERQNPANLLGMLAHYYFWLHRLEDARRTADRAIAIDESYGSRTLVKVLLAMGKKKEALVQARLVTQTPGRIGHLRDLFILGVALQQNGLEKEANDLWAVTAARWPRDSMLLQALAGAKKDIYGWEEDEKAIYVTRDAKSFAFCGRFYQEMNDAKRAEECYRLSEKLEPGHAEADRLVFLARDHPDEALAKLSATVTPQSTADLMTAFAWSLLNHRRIDEAMTWVDRVLVADPYDVKAMSLKWQLCTERKDYLCVIEYRKRLGLNTHFNVAQYKDLSRVWREQAIANGVGLAALEPASKDSPKPPKVAEIEIIPVGDRVPPEFDKLLLGMADLLPGVKVSIGAREDLPQGVYKAEWNAVVWERLIERLRDEPGRIYVVEQDLGAFDKGFAFARTDLAHGRGVVSLSRMRHLTGAPTDPGTTLGGELLVASRHRLLSQLVSTTAKLLGVSHPCDKPTCALHNKRTVMDLTIEKPALCEVHAQELKAALAGRGANP